MIVVVAGEAVGSLAVPPASAHAGATSSYTITRGLCGGRQVAISLGYVHPRSVAVGSFPGVGAYRIFVTIDSAGQACDLYGTYAAVRHENLTLTVQDLTHPFNGTALLLATLDLMPGSLAGTSGFRWSVPTRASVSQLLPGNAVLLGTADLEWIPQVVNHLNLTFEETIFADGSPSYVGDTLLFTLTVRFVADSTACFGACWSPFFDEGFTVTRAYAAVVVSA